MGGTKRQWKGWMTLLMALCVLLSGCESKQPVEQQQPSQVKSVAATFYPLYALAVNLTQGVPEMSLSCLIQPQDGCLRAYSLSEWDYLILCQQDVVIYGGRGLESFGGLFSTLSEGPIAISCLEGQKLRGSGEPTDAEESHLLGENPFLYLSVGGAMSMSASMAYALSAIDPDNAERYQANLDAYMKRLESLAQRMAEEMADTPNRRVALMNEGLGYFAEQMALNVVAQIDHEPGVALGDNEMAELLRQLEQAQAQVVILESQADMHLVEGLKAAGYQVALFDLLSAHGADGRLDAYEEIMLENSRRVANALRG